MSVALLLAAAVTNPLLPGGPDPFVVRDGGWYYYTATLANRLAIRRTRSLARLADAPEVVVWRPPARGPNARAIWAPELHRIGGRWFLYYSASSSEADDDAHRGVWVLENPGPDPLKGRWIDRGRVNTRLPGIDGTTFEAGGRRYFAYSPYQGRESVIAVARMANPWTLEGPEAVIARPDKPWEARGGRGILEGPAFLQGPRGDLFLAYSASSCFEDDYALGLLSARAGADPLRPESWTKAPSPVLAKAPAAGVYGPGHNGFFRAGGRDWIVYHANPGPGMACTGRRSPRVQEVRWSRDGRPIFPVPATGTVPGPP